MISQDDVIALIDGDSLCYITYHKFKNDFVPSLTPHLEARLNEFVQDILSQTKATKYAGFVGSDQPNFRHKLAFTKPYKGTRKVDVEARQWWALLSEHLIQKWNFQRVADIEAEDGVCIANEELNNLEGDIHPKVIICQNDKDLDQIPGTHYNYRKREFQYITVDEANWKLYRQVITGDSTDNVPGQI